MIESNKRKYIDSETYRRMLVKDGERRFHEWHTSFLNYQKQYQKDTAAIRYVQTDSKGTSENSKPSDPFGLFS
ncbi:MAG: hypothetical protein WBA57_19915 [Elainellaceae cyanobacterium]